jgi:hypothetical protein
VESGGNGFAVTGMENVGIAKSKGWMGFEGDCHAKSHGEKESSRTQHT